MTTGPALPCANCGYDLRVQPADGICPECATPVQRAVALAAIPIRPAWRDSDPRWRRRLVAGAWVLACIPLYAILVRWGLAERITVTRDLWVGRTSLADSFVSWTYTHLIFVIGVVLLFSKERGRRRHRLDWIRRWGILGSYLVFLLGFALDSLVYGLVLIGITALFFGLPFDHQPWFTMMLGEPGMALIYYGPSAEEGAWMATGAISACLILLACVPMYTALYSSGPRWLAILLLALLALSAMGSIASSAIAWAHPPLFEEMLAPLFFFDPIGVVSALEQGIVESRLFRLGDIRAVGAWLIILVIALWLSLAQMRAWRRT